jgi:outer membrane protein OmpA-like peptidoglycan-associated protein
MIALHTFAEHIDRPAIIRTQILEASSDNWMLLPVAKEVTPVEQVFPETKTTVVDTARLSGKELILHGNVYREVAIVYFPLGSYQLSPADFRKLMALPKGQYAVVGFASHIGGYTLNLHLASNRAEVVGEYLKSLGDPAPGLASMGSLATTANPDTYPVDQKAVVYKKQN